MFRRLSPLRLSSAPLLAALTGAAFTFAAPASFARGQDPCDSARTTLEANTCADRQFKALDAELNTAYQALLTQLAGYGDGAGTRKLLVAAQRKWVEFRDADCAAQQRLNQGGTVAAQVYLGCMTAHTRQRIAELQLSNWMAG